MVLAARRNSLSPETKQLNRSDIVVDKMPKMLLWFFIPDRLCLVFYRLATDEVGQANFQMLYRR